MLCFCGSHSLFSVKLLFSSVEEIVTNLCSRVLCSPSHQVLKRHVLGNRHVAELERKYLTAGWSIWKRHIDDSVEATWAHQSLWDGKKAVSIGFTFIYRRLWHTNRAITLSLGIGEISFGFLRVTRVNLNCSLNLFQHNFCTRPLCRHCNTVWTLCFWPLTPSLHVC